MTTHNTLVSPYIINNAEGGWADYACESCAVLFAENNNLTWHRPHTHDYTEENTNGYSAYELVYDSGECDYPASCECGQYLDVSLTSDGVQAMQDNDYPEWLYVAHRVRKEA